jgi:hypothetical protein
MYTFFFESFFLLFAQHVSDLTEPIVRSTTVVYAAICCRFVVFYSSRLVSVFCHIAVSRSMLDSTITLTCIFQLFYVCYIDAVFFQAGYIIHSNEQIFAVDGIC